MHIAEETDFATGHFRTFQTSLTLGHVACCRVSLIDLYYPEEST